MCNLSQGIISKYVREQGQEKEYNSKASRENPGSLFAVFNKGLMRCPYFQFIFSEKDRCSSCVGMVE